MNKSRFSLNIKDERLWNGERPVHITNKVFQLLRLFVQNPQRLLTKNEILESLWPGVYVSESLVKEYVHDLRSALGDNTKNSKFIETAHGRGYRFLGGIELMQQKQNLTLLARPRSAAPSVAVLPLENMAGGERWERFCRGMSDDLITDLSRYPDLLVIAKSSSFAYGDKRSDIRAIGNDLGANYVLDGSVQANDSKLHMNLQLIETSNGHHVWAQRYERDIEDFFVIKEDILSHAVSCLAGFRGQIPRSELLRLRRPLPHTLESYELY